MRQFLNIQVDELAVDLITEPVTVAEAKDWITGLEGVTQFDTLIERMIKGARESIENLINRALVRKTITLDVEVSGEDDESFPLPYTFSKLTTVTTDSLEINDLDSDDTETLQVIGTDYYLRNNVLRLWEGRYSITYDAVPEIVPEALKEAIKMEIAERFLNRGENPGGLSEAAKQKAMPYQQIWL